MRDFNNPLLFAGFIILELLLASSLFILWKKSRAENSKATRERFKRNILKLRHEKIKPPADNKLGELRKNLQKSPEVKLSADQETITRQAKKLSISKGELMLAARIKTLGKTKK